MECNLASYIKDFRFYDKQLTIYEIQAESAPALGGLAANQIKLSCIRCTLNEAQGNCPGSYHLCTTQELHTGVAQIAKLMGWTEWMPNIWAYEAVNVKKPMPDEKGIGICCFNQ
eukprot:TRINITY_DN11943_c0_g1_i2.p4 TRINITY_DN11943_c0_g1~~TRINITY_DN11943_c0_g1_i2.p4  ORF type:complete len:114 (+),score=24.45 TRINITY_DN11943_c0_g1_i2:698-1039(+)